MAAGQPTPGKIIEAGDFDALERLGFQAVAVPADPSAGYIKLFLNTATGELSVRKSGGTTVSLESSGGVSRTREDPTGTKDGVNTAFTISTSGDVDLYLNGVLLKETVGYTISGTSITMLAGYIPESDDTLEAIIYT